MRKLQSVIPRKMTIYKKNYLQGLCKTHGKGIDRPESTGYNACLSIIGAIRDASRETLYQELGLEPLTLHVGTENFVSFKKFLKMSILNTFSIRFL